jgi:hypothetical protein
MGGVGVRNYVIYDRPDCSHNSSRSAPYTGACDVLGGVRWVSPGVPLEAALGGPPGGCPKGSPTGALGGGISRGVFLAGGSLQGLVGSGWSGRVWYAGVYAWGTHEYHPGYVFEHGSGLRNPAIHDTATIWIDLAWFQGQKQNEKMQALHKPTET